MVINVTCESVIHVIFVGNLILLKHISLFEKPKGMRFCTYWCYVAENAAIFPIDLVRRRMQLEGAGGRARVYNTGIIGTFKHIIRSEGLKGLYRGILPEFYKVVPSVGIVFMTYETMKKLLSNNSVE